MLTRQHILPSSERPKEAVSPLPSVSASPRCPRCGGSLLPDGPFYVRSVYCLNCGFRVYRRFSRRHAEEQAKRCACGQVIEKTGRKIQTDKCDECLKLWRIENATMQHMHSRKWRDS